MEGRKEMTTLRILLMALLLIVSIVASSFIYNLVEGSNHLPLQTDWVDRGIVFQDGVEGVFGFSPKITRNNGIFQMDYITADSLRADGGPAFRELRTATSTDAITWTKDPSNPIFTHIEPAGANESGVFTVAPCYVNGVLTRFVGTMVEVASGSVRDSIELINPDGTHQLIGAWNNTSWKGYGDELDPVACYEYEDEVIMTYVCSGGSSEGGFDCLSRNDSWAKYYAKGSTPSNVSPPTTSITTHSSKRNQGSVSFLDVDGAFYMFENDNGDNTTELKIWSISDPSRPDNRNFITSWTFPCESIDVYEENGDWWGVCKDNGDIRLFTVGTPAPPEPTPTPAPSCTELTLNWGSQQFNFTPDDFPACTWSVS